MDAQKRRVPAVVILSSIVDLLVAVSALAFMALGLLGLVLGNLAATSGEIQRRFAEVPETANLKFGINFLFGLLAGSGFVVFLAFLVLGIALLGGKRVAWYAQLVVHVLAAIVGFPLWSLVAVPLLVLFFQPRVRDFFEV